MSYESIILADAPLIYWRLGESSGTTAEDTSGNNYDGTYVNNPTLSVTGIPGAGGNTAVTTNGSTQYVTRSTSEFNVGAADFTAECWYKGTDTGTNAGSGSVGPKGFMCGSTDITRKRFVVGIDASGKVRAYTGGSYVLTGPSTTAVNDGTNWHHIVLTKSSAGAVVLYIDGASEATGTVTNLGVGDPPLDVMFNRRVSGGLGYLAGTVDEVAYYDTVLTSTQVQDHYDAGISAVVDGSGASSIAFSGTALGTVSGAASGLAVLQFGATATATVTQFGTAAATLAFDASAAEAPGVTGTAAASIAMTARINLLLPIFVKRAELLPSDFSAEMLP